MNLKNRKSLPIFYLEEGVDELTKIDTLRKSIKHSP